MMSAFFQSWIGSTQSSRISSTREARPGDLRPAQPGRELAPHRERRPARAGEPDAEERDQPDGDGVPRGGRQAVGDDLPDVAHGRLDRLGDDDLVDDVVAGERADREQQHAGDRDADRDGADLAAAAAGHEPDGAGPAEDHERPDPVRDGLEPLRDVLRRRELVRLEQRDLTRVLPGSAGRGCRRTGTARRAGARAAGCRARRCRSSCRGPPPLFSSTLTSSCCAVAASATKTCWQPRPLRAPGARRDRLRRARRRRSGPTGPGGSSAADPSTAPRRRRSSRASRPSPPRPGSRIASSAMSSCAVLRKLSWSSASRLTKFESRLMTRKTIPSTTRIRAPIERPRDGRRGASGSSRRRCGRGIGHGFSSASRGSRLARGFCRRAAAHPMPLARRFQVPRAGAEQAPVPSGPSGSRLRSRGAASSSPRTPRR